MYVLQPNSTSVAVLSLNAPGQAKNIQKLDIAGPASKVGLSISECPALDPAAPPSLTPAVCFLLLRQG